MIFQPFLIIVRTYVNQNAYQFAHRLSTIMRADRVIVLHRGKIVEEGTYAALVEHDGHYRKLWELQRNGYIA